MEPTDQNRRAWDEIHRSRAEARAGAGGIPEAIRERLPEIAGKHVLHLQSGSGESTAELAELGALVTAVEASTEQLEAARGRAPNVVFMQGDAQSLPIEVQRHRFDVVFTGDDVLARLGDLDAWAGGIASALKPGGLLFFYDDHPVAGCVDHLAHWRQDYFDGEAWQLGQVVTALAGARLVLQRLEELQSVYDWVQHDKRVPGHFVLVAEKAP